MVSADLLARLGIFVRRGFLSKAICDDVVADIRSREALPASVGIARRVYAVDESLRRVSRTLAGDQTRALLDAPLRALMPSLDEHFQVSLTHYQSPNFLRYKTGDHYVPHVDSDHDRDGEVFSRERQVSAVLFLNDSSECEAVNCYGGGELTFFGLIKARNMETRGIPLTGEKGMLVAFRSDIPHQVTPVTHGERFTVVTWYASKISDEDRK